MRIDVGKTTLRSDYQGKTFYFCSEKCKHKFDINPRLLLEDVAAPDQGKSASARSGK
jgi:YHS domain-containing protein